MTNEVMRSKLRVGSLQADIDLEDRTQTLANMTSNSQRAVAGFLSKEPIEWENR